MPRKRGYGALIRDARTAAGLSQEDLARKLRTSASTISNLEREQHPPTVPEQVNDLGDALPISREELLLKMGVRLMPAPAARLPEALIERLLLLGPQKWQSLIDILPPPASGGAPEEEPVP